jgi:hypothetical protein
VACGLWGIDPYSAAFHFPYQAFAPHPVSFCELLQFQMHIQIHARMEMEGCCVL